jgi:hypothetical protein
LLITVATWVELHQTIGNITLGKNYTIKLISMAWNYISIYSQASVSDEDISFMLWTHVSLAGCPSSAVVEI